MDVLLKKYFWIVNLVVIGVCAAFAGRAAAHFIEGAYLTSDDVHAGLPLARHAAPPPPPRIHNKDDDAIIHRNVFCSGCAPVVEQQPQPGGDNGPQTADVKSSLPLELVSTMVCPNDENWSMAIIRDLSTKEKDPGMYNKGARIGSQQATVYRVLTKRV